MKTSAKKLTVYGNVGLVQVMTEPQSSFSFRPGAPELKTGGLTITESAEGGIVGMLKAINNTKSFLLLTDADVLTGAKQNRILNRSVLLAPLSETIIDVSCIERLRWHYTGHAFSNPGSVADPDLRKEKAASVAGQLSNPGDASFGTQQTVWAHVNKKLHDKKVENATESYADYLLHSEISAPSYPECEPEKGCNGLAVIFSDRVICCDLFGNEDVYKYYFPYLRNSAFRMALTDKKIKPAGIHEAFYKVLDTLDSFMAAERQPETTYNGAGSSGIINTKELVGFDLNAGGEMVHNVMFVK